MAGHDETDLGTRLLSNQDNVPRRVVDGNLVLNKKKLTLPKRRDDAKRKRNAYVGDEEPTAGQRFEAVDKGRREEEEAIRLGAVEHLALELEAL